MVDGVRVVSAVRAFMDKHPEAQVFLAMDNSADGEALAALLVRFAGLSQAKRMRLDVFTPTNLARALRDPSVLNGGVVCAREVRRVIDRLVDHHASRFYARTADQVGHDDLSFQGLAILGLLAERAQRLHSRRLMPQYTVELDLGGWTACSWVPTMPAGSPSFMAPNSWYDLDGHDVATLDDRTAELAAKQRDLLVMGSDTRCVLMSPPSPITSTNVYLEACRAFGWLPHRTAAALQGLFLGDEALGGLINCPHALEAVARPLRPLESGRLVDLSDQDQLLLYQLIRVRWLCSQMEPAQCEIQRIELADVSGRHRFFAEHRQVLDQGWMAAPWPQLDAARAQAIPANLVTQRLPQLGKGSFVRALDSSCHTVEGFDVEPYLLHQLLARLTELGVGAGDLLAPVLRRMIAVGWVVVAADGSVHCSRAAEDFCAAIYPRFRISNLGYLIELEAALCRVASGAIDGPSLVRRVWEQLEADTA
ncbi:MAG: DNA topoisomerase [Pseudomonadota bacterium]